MRRPPRKLLFPIVLFATLVPATVFAACGDDDDSSGGGNTPAISAASPTRAAPTPAVSATTGLGSSTQPQKVDVTAKDFSFDPEKITLNKSTSGGAAGSVTVSFNNEGRASHTFALYTDKDYKTKVGGAEIGATPGGGSGGSVFVAPTAATTYYFRCEIHNSMQGSIEFK